MPKLPDLPKKYNRREAKIDGLVLDWFRENYPTSVALEIKIKGNKVLPHQALALRQVADGAFSYKIPDMGRRNPFDGFTLVNAHAYVVTCDGMVCEAESIDGKGWMKFELKKKPR